MTERCDRRSFLKLSALAGGAALGMRTALGGLPSHRLLRFGVLSDLHIALYTFQSDHQELIFEKALRWFDKQGAEAIVFPGDFIHSGIVREFEIFLSVWNRVFPGGRAADGRKVERLLVTGNHEIAMWKGRIDFLGDVEWERQRFDTRIEELWERNFGEKYEKVFLRTIKGVTFVGAQYMSCHPPIEQFFREHAAELPKDRPFFFVQHAHPKNTCYGGVRGADDTGASVRALLPYPNAVALTGHSHNPLTDDRSVWQGSFTSIGCGSAWGSGASYLGYDNALAPYWKEFDGNRKWTVEKVYGQHDAGRGCLLIDVYVDRLDVKRWSLDFDEPLGADWHIPIPATKGGPFDFAWCAGTMSPPEFPKGAEMYVTQEVVPWDSHLGRKLKQKPCISVLFPSAVAGGSRVFDYVVTAVADGKEIARSQLIAEGFAVPEKRMNLGEECIFGRHELPMGCEIVFTVRPRNCYGVAGSPLAVRSVLKG